MALIEHHEYQWWLVDGYTLKPQDPKVRGRQHESGTSLRVWANSAGQAEQRFSSNYVLDVRVTSVRLVSP